MNLNTAKPSDVNRLLDEEKRRRKQAEKALHQSEKRFRELVAELEQRVRERTAELLETNEQLRLEIQDRKRVVQALKENEERYRALFENNPIGTIIVNHEARVVGYNLAKGDSADRLPKIGDIMYKDYAGRHKINMYSELIECIRSGVSKEFPEQQYDNRFLHIRISPFSGGAIITSIDITYRKRVEKALRESEKRYRTLVETIPHGIQEIDTQGTITFANSALEKTFGYPVGGLIGKSILDLLATDSERDEMSHFLAGLIAEKPSPVPYHNKCVTMDGTFIDIQTDWDYKRNPNGDVTGFISIITDITNRMRAVEEKKQLESRLHHAQKMEAIGTLAGGIAHDFNNILGSILLNTELAIDDLEAGSETCYALEQVLKGSHRAKDLVEQILTFSRESEIKRKPLKINSLVKETLKMLRAMLPATIGIQHDIEDDIGTILADPTQIQQLVMNLCNNAAHAMSLKGGQLLVSLRNEMLDNPPAASDLVPGLYVALEISDIGCGIQEEIKDRIFDPFFTTKPPGEGTGLGLSVVHGIVINHEGHIVVDSQPGSGSTFQVFLPVIDEEAMAATQEAYASIPMGRQERLLFVDDEEVVVDANKRILERLGYRVAVASNGHEALEIFEERPGDFDLIITDMTMPNMTGLELAQRLIEVRPDIPIILCTGYSQFITPEKAHRIGIHAFVMKPFARYEIAEAIRNVLDKQPSHSLLTPGNGPYIG